MTLGSFRKAAQLQIIMACAMFDGLQTNHLEYVLLIVSQCSAQSQHMFLIAFICLKCLAPASQLYTELDIMLQQQQCAQNKLVA